MFSRRQILKGLGAVPFLGFLAGWVGAEGARAARELGPDRLVPFWDTEEGVMAWLDQVERVRGVGPNLGISVFCPETGTTYKTICPNYKTDSVKPEGYRCRYSKTPGEAWYQWRLAFDLYEQGRTGKLYWRHKPELSKDFSGGYGIYARLVIDPTGPLPWHVRKDGSTDPDKATLRVVKSS